MPTRKKQKNSKKNKNQIWPEKHEIMGLFAYKTIGRKQNAKRSADLLALHKIRSDKYKGIQEEDALMVFKSIGNILSTELPTRYVGTLTSPSDIYNVAKNRSITPEEKWRFQGFNAGREEETLLRRNVPEHSKKAWKRLRSNAVSTNVAGILLGYALLVTDLRGAE